MRIFGLNILTDKQLDDYGDMRSRTTKRDIFNFLAAAIIPELKRLKEEHWDKDAFDRLIDFFRR